MSLRRGLDELDEPYRNDPRPIEELIPLAMKWDDDPLKPLDEDSIKSLNALAALQARGNNEVFEAARKLCESKDPRERSLGATILGQNVVHRKDFPEEKFDILFGLLGNERDLEVLYSTLFSLGHIRDPRAIEPILKFKNHPDSDIRFAVAHGLWEYKDRRAIDALIELSTDEADTVRDWATFGLGQMIETNTKKVREALAARLDDPFEDARVEAVIGLALRKDRRALEPLRIALETDSIVDRAFEAATALADPSLLPALLEWREEDKINESLEEAIEACGGEAIR